MAVSRRGLPSPLILHEPAFVVVGPSQAPVRLRPMMFDLLKYLLSLPPQYVARYDTLEPVLWPNGIGLPSQPQALIRWHTHHLNKLLLLAGCTIDNGFPAPLIRAVDRIGLECRIPPNLVILIPLSPTTSQRQASASSVENIIPGSVQRS